MTGDIVSISGQASHNQKRETKPTEEFQMSAQSQNVAVEAQQQNSPGPAYILQLSPEARELIAKKRAESSK